MTKLSELRSTSLQTTWALTDVIYVVTAGDLSKAMYLEDLFTEIVSGVVIKTADGIDIDRPGGDGDCDLITLNVTGSPRFWWDEAHDSFVFTNSGYGTEFKINTYVGQYHTIVVGDNVLARGGTTQRSVLFGIDIADGKALNAGTDNMEGCDNVLIGSQIGRNMQLPARRNIAVGSYALEDLTVGYANIALGYRSSTNVTSGCCTIGIGDGALMLATDSYNCVCMGIEAGLSLGNAGTKQRVTAIGHHAAYGGAPGSGHEFDYEAGNLSTWIGADAGGALRSVSTHANTTAVGAQAGYLGGANCIYVGFNAGRSNVTDNRFFLDALDRSGEANEQTKSLLYGAFDADPANQWLVVNGQFRFSQGSRHNDAVRAYFGTDNDGSVYHSGSSVMYIDTGSVTNLLEVSGDLTIKGDRLQVYPSAASADARLDLIGAGNSGFYFEQKDGQTAYIWNIDGGDIIFGTNNTDRMRVRWDGNLCLGEQAAGASATKTFCIGNGTAPTGNRTDACQIYSNDQAAGNACPHIRTENSAVLKLYQETTGVTSATVVQNSGAGVNEATTFDGYTLAQVVKALRNLGVLA